LLVGGARGTALANPADIDPTFGIFGRVTTAIGQAYKPGNAVVRQNDGRVVVAGSAWNGSNYDFGLARYDLSGALDSTFGTGGVVTTPVGTADDEAMAVIVQSDGKLVLAGSTVTAGDYNFALVRYNTNGALDSTFGTGGKVTTALNGFDVANALALQSDGKLVAAGVSASGTGSDVALVRYNTNGTPDGTFGTAGKVTMSVDNADDGALAVAIQGDGKIAVAGTSFNGSDYDLALVRFSTGGVPDAGFGAGGVVTSGIGPADDVATAILQQPDGKIVVAGYASDGTDFDFAIARYTSGGVLDGGFGTGGVTTTPIGSTADIGGGLARQSDGKLIVAGYTMGASDLEIAVARYDSGGLLDPAFGTGGTIVTPIGVADDLAVAVVLTPDGRIVVAGSSVYQGNSRAALVRYRGEATSLGCSLNAHCNDGISCTVDTCVSNDCHHSPDNAACNDGTGCTTDTCSTSLGCQYAQAPVNTPCESDGTICSTHRCNASGQCIHTPGPDLTCTPSVIPLKSNLLIKDAPVDNGDKVVFTWSGGPGVPIADLGSPATSTSYHLCVFDHSASVPSLAFKGRLAAGGTCGAGPCWTPLVNGFKFKDTSGGLDGMTAAVLKANQVASRSKFKVTGKGLPLVMPTLPLFKNPYVRAELHNSAGKCWSAQFSTPTFNIATQFKSKSD
jgi:uncharacterized delta-60 repeat protein